LEIKVAVATTIISFARIIFINDFDYYTNTPSSEPKKRKDKERGGTRGLLHRSADVFCS
jgi:hypothetical protein